jgi:hypothetical protein
MTATELADELLTRSTAVPGVGARESAAVSAQATAPPNTAESRPCQSSRFSSSLLDSWPWVKHSRYADASVRGVVR